MDIYISNIDAITVKQLDEFAQAKGISRTEYVRQLLKAHVQSEVISMAFDKYEPLVRAVLAVVQENTKALHEIQAVLLESEVNE